MLDALTALSAGELIALAIAGAVGLLAHYLLKLIELRKQLAGQKKLPTLRVYYVDHAPETILSVMITYVGIYWTIETNQASLLTAFLIGLAIDSVINKFRDRANNLASKI